VLSTLTLNSFYYLVEHYFDPNKEDTAGGNTFIGGVGRYCPAVLNNSTY